jgi:hypothetical protein
MAQDVEAAGDRPATKSTSDEIEVTPEMIEAGVEDLWSVTCEPSELEMRNALIKIYRAMHAVRPKSAHGVQVSCRTDV